MLLLEEAANHLDPFNNNTHRELYARIQEHLKLPHNLINKSYVLGKLRERADHYQGWFAAYAKDPDREHEMISAAGSWMALDHIIRLFNPTAQQKEDLMTELKAFVLANFVKEIDQQIKDLPNDKA